jgi:Skp family chaperone for outer membrane proteins
MEGIMQKVNDIVQKIADSGKYDIIFQRDVVAFGSPRLDITPQIINALKEDKK